MGQSLSKYQDPKKKKLHFFFFSNLASTPSTHFPVPWNTSEKRNSQSTKSQTKPVNEKQKTYTFSSLLGRKIPQKKKKNSAKEMFRNLTQATKVRVNNQHKKISTNIKPINFRQTLYDRLLVTGFFPLFD